MEAMTRRIGITNQKGGVSKTTNTINVAGALAANGVDVLAVDMDPQGTLTANLGHGKLFDDLDKLSLDEVLLDVNKWDQITDLVIEHDEFDVIPANSTYTGNKTPLDSADAGEKRLGKILTRLETDYHYVVCDCPPDFSAFAKNAVTAGENVVVPMVPRSEMVHSTNLLFDMYDTLGMMHDLDIEYLAFTMTYTSTKQTKEMREVLEWFDDTFGENGVKIDDRAAFDRAKWEAGSIYVHEESLQNDEFAQFDKVVKRVLDQTAPPDFNGDVDAMRQKSTKEIRSREIEA